MSTAWQKENIECNNEATHKITKAQISEMFNSIFLFRFRLNSDILSILFQTLQDQDTPSLCNPRYYFCFCTSAPNRYFYFKMSCALGALYMQSVCSSCLECSFTDITCWNISFSLGLYFSSYLKTWFECFPIKINIF